MLIFFLCISIEVNWSSLLIHRHPRGTVRDSGCKQQQTALGASRRAPAWASLAHTTTQSTLTCVRIHTVSCASASVTYQKTVHLLIPTSLASSTQRVTRGTPCGRLGRWKVTAYLNLNFARRHTHRIFIKYMKKKVHTALGCMRLTLGGKGDHDRQLC